MKTIQDYLNDPRMLNDPGMAAALDPVKEIHAARLMIQDETAGMGLPPPQIVNLSGQGKLKPRQPVTQ
jgi:hypothetical protein